MAERLGQAGLTVLYEQFDGRSGTIPWSARANVVVVSPASIVHEWRSLAFEAVKRLRSSGGRLLLVVLGDVHSADLPAAPTIRFPAVSGPADARAFQILLATLRAPVMVSNLPPEPSGVPVRDAELRNLAAFFDTEGPRPRMAAIVRARRWSATAGRSPW